MTGVQPPYTQPPGEPPRGAGVGAYDKHYTGTYNGVIGGLEGIAKKVLEWLARFAAQIQALEKLAKLEQEVNGAVQAYRQAMEGKGPLPNAKSVLKAVANLLKFLKGGYKQFAHGDKYTLAAINTELKNAIGGDPKEGQPSFKEILAGLGGSAYGDELEKWLKGEITNQQFLPAFKKALAAAASKPEARQPAFIQRAWIQLEGRASSVSGAVQQESAMFEKKEESQYTAASKIANKAYQTILTAIKLIPAG